MTYERRQLYVEDFAHGDFVNWLTGKADFYGYDVTGAEESDEGEWDVTVKMGHEPNVSNLT